MVLNLVNNTEFPLMTYGEMDLDLATVLSETQSLAPGIEASVDVFANSEDLMELSEVVVDGSEVAVSPPDNLYSLMDLQ